MPIFLDKMLLSSYVLFDMSLLQLSLFRIVKASLLLQTKSGKKQAGLSAHFHSSVIAFKCDIAMLNRIAHHSVQTKSIQAMWQIFEFVFHIFTSSAWIAIQSPAVMPLRLLFLILFFYFHADTSVAKAAQTFRWLHFSFFQNAFGEYSDVALGILLWNVASHICARNDRILFMMQCFCSPQGLIYGTYTIDASTQTKDEKKIIFSVSFGMC